MTTPSTAPRTRRRGATWKERVASPRRAPEPQREPGLIEWTLGKEPEPEEEPREHVWGKEHGVPALEYPPGSVWLVILGGVVVGLITIASAIFLDDARFLLTAIPITLIVGVVMALPATTTHSHWRKSP